MNKTKKKLTKKSDTILYVEWKDHTSGGLRWVDEKDVAPFSLICRSVGFLVNEDKDVLVLCLNKTDNGDVSDQMHIVKSCITKRSKIG